MPLFEKKKVLIPLSPPSIPFITERYIFQLLDAMRLNDQGLLNSYKATAKTQSTMDKKFFIPLYAEHIHFLIKRCGRLVTRIYSYNTFEQGTFKKEFVIINQVSRQNSETSVEKDFYKLMNNSNFSYGCRNNADNCSFAPLFDEIKELTYVKRSFDSEILQFVSSDLLEREIE